MERLMMVPFLVGGILIIVYRHRLADAFNASNRAFHGSVLGAERTARLEGRPATRGHRFNQAWGRWFLLFFGSAWIAISLLVLVGPLIGLRE